jgi:hypothetical protein
VAVAVFFQLLRPPVDKLADPSAQWRDDVPMIYDMPCDTWYHDAQVQPCAVGPLDAPKTVVMLGDSIGAQWFSMVPAIFPAPEWLTVILTKSACPLVDENFFYARIGKMYDVCVEWRGAALAWLEQRKPEVIIAGSAITYEFTETQWIEGSARVFERLSRAAKSVAVIPGTPILGFDGPGCVAQRLTPAGGFDPTECAAAQDRLARAETVALYLAQAASRFQNVHLLRLNDLVCPASICAARNQAGLVVFRDSQHLTDSFVRSVIPSIEQRIVNLGITR